MGPVRHGKTAIRLKRRISLTKKTVILRKRSNLNSFKEKAMRKLLNKVRETTAKADPASHEKETKKAHSEIEVKTC